MSMTRKHFVDLANALKWARPDVEETSPEYLLWEHICREIASVCVRHNGAFNRSRFMAACRGEK